jgi:hypothetical protein
MLKDDAIYLGDNGRAFCGVHAGNSAAYTGRDLSGQAVMEITPYVLRAAPWARRIACEECGRRPSRIVRVAS